jgi:hypothetical protein
MACCATLYQIQSNTLAVCGTEPAICGWLDALVLLLGATASNCSLCKSCSEQRGRRVHSRKDNGFFLGFAQN